MNKKILENLLATARYAYSQANDSNISILYDHELRSDAEANEQLKELKQCVDYCEQRLADHDYIDSIQQITAAIQPLYFCCFFAASAIAD